MEPEQLYTPEQAEAYRRGEREELMYPPRVYEEPDLQYHFELGYYAARAEADYAECLCDLLDQD